MVVPGSPSELPDHADVRNPNGQNKKLIGGKMKKSVLLLPLILLPTSFSRRSLKAGISLTI